MPVSAEYRTFVLEQLGGVKPVTARAMFGGVGIYSGDLFFALIAGDTLYFKVDAANRSDYETRGMKPFMPYGNSKQVMQYYQVPADVLEDVDALRLWMEKAIGVARAKRSRPKKRK